MAINNYNNPFGMRGVGGNYQARMAQNEIQNFFAQCPGVFSYEEQRILCDPNMSWQHDQIIRNGMDQALWMGYSESKVRQGANELRQYCNMLDGSGGLGCWDPYNTGDIWPYADRGGWNFDDQYMRWCNIFEFPNQNYYDNYWGGDDYGNSYEKSLKAYRKAETFDHLGQGAGHLLSAALNWLF